MSASKLESLFWFQVLGTPIPEPEPEYKFHPSRRWRIDFAWPALKLAVEIEGGIWNQGRHTRGSGVKGDMEKYNTLAVMGWRLLRFDGDAVRSGDAIAFVESVVKGMLPPEEGAAHLGKPLSLHAFHEALIDLTDRVYLGLDGAHCASVDAGAAALGLATASAGLLMLHEAQYGESDAVRFCRVACASAFNETVK
jgi:hypothetical protein